METIRNSLAATCRYQLRFTHEDLGMHNILVEGGKITAIIDWEYAGWYPEYWDLLSCFVQPLKGVRHPMQRYDHLVVLHNP